MVLTGVIAIFILTMWLSYFSKFELHEPLTFHSIMLGLSRLLPNSHNSLRKGNQQTLLNVKKVNPVLGTPVSSHEKCCLDRVRCINLIN